MLRTLTWHDALQHLCQLNSCMNRTIGLNYFKIRIATLTLGRTASSFKRSGLRVFEFPEIPWSSTIYNQFQPFKTTKYFVLLYVISVDLASNLIFPLYKSNYNHVANTWVRLPVWSLFQHLNQDTCTARALCVGHPTIFQLQPAERNKSVL